MKNSAPPWTNYHPNKMKNQETEDAELVALAALVFQEAVLMNGTNEQRAFCGEAAAYVDTSHTDAYVELNRRLRERAAADKLK